MKTYILCFVFFALSAAQEDMSGRVLIFPHETATAYTILKPETAQPLRQFTVCLRSYTHLTRDYALFSLATAEKDNMFLIYVKPPNQYAIYINNEEILFKVDNQDLNWRHMCVSWDSDSGVVQFWFDGKLLPRQAAGVGITFPSTFIIILGQDQDSLEGGFDVKQSFKGEVTDVNMWDNELTPEEIYTVPINGKIGNILNWSSLSYENKGNVLIRPKLQCKHWQYTVTPYSPCLIGRTYKYIYSQ